MVIIYRASSAHYCTALVAHLLLLRNSEISTIERKLSHTESTCKIKLDRKFE